MQRALLDLDAIPTMFPDEIATSAELVGLGMSSRTILQRCRPDGPWQHLQPGIVLMSNAPPGRAHLLRAALKIAGRDAVVTGHDALRLQDMLAGSPAMDAHLLVAPRRRLRRLPSVTFERADPVPKPLLRKGFPVAPAARALIDACRTLSSTDEARALLTDALRRGAVTTATLRQELTTAGQRGCALPRKVLAEIDDGVRSVAEGWARRLVARAGLPAPRWQVPVHEPNGQLLATVDAWWDAVGLAWDLGAYRFGNSRADHARALRRCARLAAAGVIVVHTPPLDLRDDPAGVADELRAAHANASLRPRPQVVAA